MNILVINLHSGHNHGDRLLLETTMEVLRCTFPQARIVLAVNDPLSYADSTADQILPSLTWWVKRPEKSRSRWLLGPLAAFPFQVGAAIAALSLARRGYNGTLRYFSGPQRQLLEAIRTADAVVAAPGNYLYSSGHLGLSVLLAMLSQWLAIAAGKPLYLFPQTIGPLKRRWEYTLLHSVLSRARITFLRDTFSIKTLSTVGGHPLRALIVPDMALATKRIPPSQGRELLAAHGIALDRPTLGVTVLDWGRFDRSFTEQTAYEQAVANTIDFFITNYSGQAILFPQVKGPSEAEDDRIPSRRIASQVRNRAKVFLVEDIPSLSHLLSAYGLMDLFLGTRLHSNIFALTQGVPVLAIAYQPKTVGVMKTIGLEAWVVPIQGINAEQLQERLVALWLQRDTIRARLATSFAEIQKLTVWIGEIMRRDLERSVP